MTGLNRRVMPVGNTEIHPVTWFSRLNRCARYSVSISYLVTGRATTSHDTDLSPQLQNVHSIDLACLVVSGCKKGINRSRLLEESMRILSIDLRVSGGLIEADLGKRSRGT